MAYEHTRWRIKIDLHYAFICILGTSIHWMFVHVGCHVSQGLFGDVSLVHYYPKNPQFHLN